MSHFREPGPDDEPTGVERGVWTTRRTAQPNTQPAGRTATAMAPLPPMTATDLPAAPVADRRLRVRSILRRIVRVVVILSLTFVLLTLAQIVAYRWIAPPTSMLMLAQRVTGAPVTRAWRSIDKISPNLARAVIMSEDAGFCGHRGVDWKELERVYEQSLEGGSTGGGSTLSMQVTKNLFLWPSKSYVRKAIEVPLTLLADRWWGKPRMLEIYLNIAEWGPGIFGAEAAARAYFKKSALELTESEAALLAVALPNPLQRNAANPAPLQRRLANTVQGRMKIGASNMRCLVRTTV